ncbi:MAG: hypothetical protein C4K47_01085 [Candidatus Thorarchaeota archaeon]|nr:MAG: hypothetical protein C4K47_01085 [Candidatus Thorarchaeota archaeon]
MWWIIYLAMYWSAGLTLKTGDDLLDELNRPNLAWFPLGLSGLFFGTVMTLSQWDMAMLGAVVIGVLLTGKVDKPQFMAGFLLIGLLLAIRGIPVVTAWLDWWALLIMLLLAAAIDEVGHGIMESGTQGVIGFSKISNAAWFFRHRFTLKLSALLLCILWPGLFPSAVGIWMFDLGYEIAGSLLKSKRSAILGK